MEQKKYTINNKEYTLKERYTLKDWGKILQILSVVEKNNIENSIIVLLADNKITELLDIILDKKIEGDIYEEDFETINQVIQDFFSRKKSLMKSTNINS